MSSFVMDMNDDQNDMMIVRATIGLAHNMGLSVVAEGVETEGQLGFLREQACNEVQGFYFSEPKPADQFEAFVRAEHPSAWPAR